MRDRRSTTEYKLLQSEKLPEDDEVDVHTSRSLFIRLFIFTSMLNLCAHFQMNHIATGNIYDVVKPWLLAHVESDPSVVGNYWSIFASALIFGKPIGNFFVGFMAERFGRKKSIIFCILLLFSGAVFVSIVQISELFFLAVFGRVILGAATGAAINLSTLLLTESCHENVRGFFLGMEQSFYGLGEFFGIVVLMPEFLGTEKLWPFATMAGCLPALLVLPFLIIFLPESPRYIYFKVGETKKFWKSLVFYHGDREVSEVFQKIEEEAINQEKQTAKEQVKLQHLFTVPSFRRSLLRCLAIRFFNVMSGIAALVSFTVPLLNNLGIPYSWATKIVAVASVCKFVSAVVVPLLMDRLGRRGLIILGALTSALVYMVIILVQLFSFNGKDIITAICICLLYVMFSFQGAGANTIICELFPQRARALGLSVVTTISSFLGASCALVFLPLLEHAGFQYLLLQYLVMDLLLAAFTWFKVPETSGKSLGEIDNFE